MVQALEEIIAKSSSIVVLWRGGRFHRERHPGLPQCGRTLSSEVRLPAGNHPEPYFLGGEPEEFYRFYRDKLIEGASQRGPTCGWQAEGRGRLKAVVTLNIGRPWCIR